MPASSRTYRCLFVCNRCAAPHHVRAHERALQLPYQGNPGTPGSYANSSHLGPVADLTLLRQQFQRLKIGHSYTSKVCITSLICKKSKQDYVCLHKVNGAERGSALPSSQDTVLDGARTGCPCKSKSLQHDAGFVLCKYHSSYNPDIKKKIILSSYNPDTKKKKKTTKKN